MHRRSFLAAFAALPTLSAKERSRLIALEGARNFRDIGGYPAAAGKRIKWGRVYRADSLANLTGSDYEKLAALGIRVVCDYRSRFERDREPTEWRGSEAPVFEILDIMAADPKRADEDPTKSFVAQLMKAGASPETASALMSESMATMALTAAPLYGRMIRLLLAANAPLVYHCSAGKDRTGLSTALLMKVLGVPDESIYEDYLLVNTISPPERGAGEMAKRLSAMTGQTVDAALLAPLMGTRREWLEGAFRAIDREYGSFERYRREALSVSDAAAESLRARLLE